MLYIILAVHIECTVVVLYTRFLCVQHRGVLKQQVGSPDWGQEVSDILRLGIQRPKKGHDAGDHPPITPMKSATEAELGHDAWRLYDYITRHFIATVSD